MKVYVRFKILQSNPDRKQDVVLGTVMCQSSLVIDS
jgi:hypothetical protein